MIFRLLLAQVLALAILLPSISHAQNASGPQIGARVEDFQLTDQYGETQKLSDLLADGPIALVAIRSAGWCPNCKDQLIQLQSDFKSFRKAGLRIVALSFDSVEVLKDFSDLNKIEFPLLSDPKSKVIQQLGIINTTRKKGTLRYRVAHPLTIMINADSTVAGVVTKTTNALPNSKQLLAAWDPIKPDEPLQKLPFISVLGNKFVNQNGEQVVFKGLAIRIPVHPAR